MMNIRGETPWLKDNSSTCLSHDDHCKTGASNRTGFLQQKLLRQELNEFQTERSLIYANYIMGAEKTQREYHRVE